MSSLDAFGPRAPVAAEALSGTGAAARSRAAAAIYACTIFFSAFLLFQVEPIMARLILPWFGGSAAVWTVTILFFQVVLVLGYLYAHLLVRYVQPRSQMFVHVPLLVASLLVLPILPAASWKPSGGHDPTLRILGLLTLTVGLPFLLLSTSGPLLQAWYARGRSRPYRLFAVSNAASLLGLLSYPLVVEPWLGARAQADAWSVAYGLFVAATAAITVRAGLSARRAGPAATAQRPPAGRREGRARLADRARWLLLAGAPSLLFLAVTNQLTRNVAPIPLLWVLPLAIYLLSLVLCFESDSWYRRRPFLPLFGVVLALVADNLFPRELAVGITGQIAFLSAALLVCCIVCHGELARLKPPAGDLTSFYLTVAVGGALGGVFAGVLAPRVFSDYFELALGLVLCAAAVLAVLLPELLRSGRHRPVHRRALALAAIAFTTLLGLYVLNKCLEYDRGDRLIGRDFYGVLSVRETGAPGPTALRTLYSGPIVHGEQLLAAGRRRVPTAYFGRESGVGILLRDEDHLHDRLRVGVVGLGVGTIAAYGRRGDVYRFYEIDPLDIRLARSQFSYLRESPAQVHVIEGDGRLSLEREAGRRFDVIALDAFTGDAIPIHLITAEAFRLYFRELARDGVLAVHVSNRFLNLAPVVARAARALGKTAVLVESPGDSREWLIKRSEWVLVTGDRRLARRLARDGHGTVLGGAGGRLWTDDYSDVIGALR